VVSQKVCPFQWYTVIVIIPPQAWFKESGESKITKAGFSKLLYNLRSFKKDDETF
jgi:hypothetical protein